MRVFVILLISAFGILSCKKETKNKVPFEMYQTSELAKMMEEMYVFNDTLKQQILSNRVLSEMTFDLEELHTMKMTDRFERDENFNKLAEVYKKYQSQLYNVAQDSLTTVYNNAINTCVVCHQGSCTGPIPRIKKLLIQ